MLRILIAIAVAASAVPAILVLESYGFEWLDWEMWKHVISSYTTGRESVPTGFMLCLAWSVIAPLVATGLLYSGSRTLRQEVRVRRTEKVVPTRKAAKRKKTRTAASDPDTQTTETLLPASPEATQDMDGIVETIDCLEPGGPASTEPEEQEAEAPKGPSVAQRMAQKVAERRESARQRKEEKQDAKKADDHEAAARPVRMSKLREHAAEIARDTRSMVQDTLAPIEDDDEEFDVETPADTTAKDDGRSASQPTSTAAWLKAKLGLGSKPEKKHVTHEREDSKGRQTSNEATRHDGVASAPGQKVFDEQSLTAEILSFYALWTNAGQAGRTQKMRQQAKRLATQIDESISGIMVQEHGMRGFAALNTLRTAAGLDGKDGTAGTEGPAQPMPKPGDEDLIDTGIHREPQEDQEAAENLGTSANQEKDNDHANSQDEGVGKDFELDDDELQIAMPAGDTSDDDGYEAQDGYTASAGTSKLDDDDAGVVDDSLIETETGESGTDRESMIRIAAQTLGTTDRNPSEERADGADDNFEDVPEEAFGEDEADDDWEISNPAEEAGENADPYGFGEAVDIIDDIGGAAPDEDDEEEDPWVTTNPAPTGGEPANQKCDDEDDDLSDEETYEPYPQEWKEAPASPQPEPKRMPEANQATSAALRSVMAQALEQQIDGLVAYQARAYAWEQLGENPPEEFDTEEKRKTFLYRSATAIVTLKEQISDADLEDLRTNMSDEKVRWLDGRADAIMNTLLRGGKSSEAHGHMGAHDHPTENGWVEYRYPDAWAVISPIARKYRDLAQANEIRYYKSAPINPSGPDEEIDELHDQIDVLLSDPRTPQEGGGFRPGMLGISFAIIPKGAWMVTKEEATGEYPEAWVLKAEAGRGGRVRLRDRTIAIFKEWARYRNRRPGGVLHLIVEEGARVDGLEGKTEIAQRIAHTMGADRNIEVVADVWNEKDWGERVVPKLLGSTSG